MNETKTVNCAKHGDYICTGITLPFTGKKLWHSCPECSKEWKEKERKEKEDQQARLEAERWQKRMGAANIPERFLDCTLESYIPATETQVLAHQKAKRYADLFQQGRVAKNALFSGGVGTGKTHLACGIALHIIKEYGKHAVFVTVQRLIRAVRDTWRRDSPLSESDVVEGYTQPDLLIIDEVGVQAGTENERQILFDVLNERYERRRATILLTNLKAEECKAFLGARVFDRLLEDGCVSIVFNWESYRGKK